MRKNNKNYAIAVIDIGKTNKKITLFSPELKIIHSDLTQIGESTVGEFLAEDSIELKNWILKKLKGIANQYPINVISTTTFGCTIALLNQEGNLIFPVISYNQEPEKDLKEKFLETFGRKEDLYLKTGTPPIGAVVKYWSSVILVEEKIYQRIS